MRRRRAEVVLIARAVGYGSIAVSLILTGAAALAHGSTLGIAGLVVGATRWLDPLVRSSDCDWSCSPSARASSRSWVSAPSP